jgi:hypothetical protein
MGARRCINDFSAPSSANVRTGPETNIKDGSFELKPALINMAQQSPFCGKALEDANAHLQHFLEICSIHYLRSDSGCGMSLPLSIFIAKKGETMVLFQQGGSGNPGEVLQCISRQVFSVWQNQCPPEQDLLVSVTHG